jgi:predicted permease
MERELTAHLTLLEDEFQRHGMSREEARRAARRATAGVEWTKDLHRDTRSFVWLEDARRDVQYGMRTLVRNPGFATVIVLTLALGVGANTAIFSVVNALLLQPLPYKDANRLVRLMVNLPAAASPTGQPLRMPVSLSAAEIAEVQSRTRTLSHVGTAAPILRALTGHEEGARLPGARVSSAIFEVIGARPLLGRRFDASDEAPGAAPVVLLSHSAWQRFFGGNPNIVGENLTLDSVLGPRVRISYSVIGVMPPEFEFPALQLEFWIPFQVTAAGGAAATRGSVVARLADGVSIPTGVSDVGPIVREIRNYPPDAAYELVTEQAELVAPVKPALMVLMGAVGFVLLIACVNVANLMLARMTVRQREIGIRAALGGGRGRLVRQALTESLVLALLGGVAGTILAIGGTRLLQTLGTTVSRVDLATSAALPRLDAVGVDLYVLAFTVATSIATGLLFGLAPVVRLCRSDPMHALKAPVASGGSGLEARRSGIRGVLVVAEIALAMVLLVGAGLLIHSFIKLSSVDAGYNPTSVLTFQVSLPNDRYPDARLKTFAESLVARLRSIPGVEAAAYANQLPMVGLRDTGGGLWRTPDSQRKPSPGGPDARFVSRDYLEVMGIRVVAGRGFTEADAEGQPRVLLVNEALARRDFAGENPVGKLVYVGRDLAPWQIVGVVENVRQFGLDREPEPQFFADLRQWSGTGLLLFPGGAYYAARTNGDPMAIISAVRRIVRELDTQAALFYVAPMEQVVATTMARPRMYAALLAIFASVGTTLAAIGIYGVLAYSVTRRTREIGIRMALGAQRLQVMKLVLGQSMSLTAIGIALGLLGALAVTRYLEGLLFGLTPLDPATFLVGSLVFAVVAFVASYLPASRASRVDPLIALRCE